MNRAVVTELCVRLHLGSPIGEPQAIFGGLQHRMWRVTTTSGRYAVKRLNPERLRLPQARQRFIVTEQIAATFNTVGIPTVSALGYADVPLHDIGGDVFIVYPWIEGIVLPLNAATPEQCRLIGHSLGRMHMQQFGLAGLERATFKFPYPSFTREHWHSLVHQVFDLGAPWADMVSTLLPTITAYDAKYALAREELSKVLVVSHRDLDQKNVLWINSKDFAIVDWEAAGQINPAMDLFVCALNWSGLQACAVQQDVFKEFIRAYLSVNTSIKTSTIVAYYGCVGKWLNWLEYNLQRTLDTTVLYTEKTQIVFPEIIKTLSILRSLVSQKDEWIGWVDTMSILK